MYIANSLLNIFEEELNHFIEGIDDTLITPLPEPTKIISSALSKISKDYRNKFIKFADLESADEIILVGSGKGVISVSSIPSIKWFSSSSKMFNRLLAIYKEQLK